MTKKGCYNCKYKRRRPNSQPCKFCLEEGYGAHPLWEEEVDND